MTVRRPAFRAPLFALALLATPALAAEKSVTVGGTTYTVQGLVGVGRIPASTRDSFGETFGSGSGMALVPDSWRKTATGYAGTVLLLPDRGYNVEGTTDYRNRLNRIDIEFTPQAIGAASATQDQVKAKLAATMLLTDEAGQPTTGLDPVAVRPAAGAMPPLPQAVNGKVSLDPEAVMLRPDGSLIITDEYGPYVYRFSPEGRLVAALQPPQALLPMRKGALNFSSNNPGPGAPQPEPKNPDTGRQNNQGLEGAALTPDGRFLVAVLQSATRQDGGDSPATRNHTRALVWDMADGAAPKLVHEYVVPLPVFKDKDKTLVAAESELVALSDTRFLLLSRDSNNGWGVKGDTSLYRSIDILDFAGATDLAGTDYDGLKPVAPKGVLAEGLKPATLTPFLDINDNSELNRFGLHNGAPKDRNLLSEKWEAMTLAPALDAAKPDDYFLFVANDNDFITQDGFQAGAPYKDASGTDVDTMVLVYRVTLPGVK